MMTESDPPLAVDWHSVVGMLIKYMLGRESNKLSLLAPPVTVIGAQFI